MSAVRNAIISMIVTAMLFMAVPVQASGTSIPPDKPRSTAAMQEVREISASDYQELVDALKASGAVPVDGGRIKYDVEGIGSIVLQDISADEGGDGTMGPNLGGGGGWDHPYVSFNRVDQAAIIAGGGVVLVAAICALGPVGVVACAVAGTLVAIAGVYLAAYGRCSEAYPNLRVYVRTRWVGGCYQ